MISLLFEASSKRSYILKQLDRTFEKLKLNPKDKNVISEIENLIRKFSRINKVKFGVVNDTSGYVIPLYKPLFPRFIVKKLNDKSTQTKVRVEESSEYINSVYIYFGRSMISLLTSKELTAVILHEIGHSFYNTSKLSFIIPRLFKRVLAGISMKLLLFPGTSIIIFSLLILMTPLSIYEHIAEYNADSFAVKYGYGDEIISALNKIEGLNPEKNNNHNKVVKLLKKFFKYLYSLTLGSHPLTENRVCDIYKKMVDDYSELYPKISKQVRTLYKQLC